MSSNPTALYTVAVLAFASLFLTACDDFSADAQAVRASWSQYWDAVDAGKSDEVCKLLTAASFDRYDNLIRRALDGTATETKMLSPMDQLEVLVMRCAMSRSELKKMKGADYVKRAVDDGWWSTSRQRAEIQNVKIRKDVATAVRVRNDIELGVEFVREDGVWKIDVPAIDRYYSDRFSEVAAKSGLTESELIIKSIEFRFGRQDRAALYEPMR